MSGIVESLNVGVATGISLYELKFRMVLAMLIKYIRSSIGREIHITGKMIMQALDAELHKVSDLNNWQVVLLMILKCDEVMTLVLPITNAFRSQGLLFLVNYSEVVNCKGGSIS